MLREEIKETLGPALTEALEKRGFADLTAVQEAVLLEDATAHDLRISSQTGSGKTVAIGLALRSFLGEPTPAASGVARPRALVIVPTRELAKQVEEELRWLFAPLGARVMCVTGGGGYRDEMRAFVAGPAIIVGTPGRMLDHLNRHGIDPSEIRAAVLDEADRMLDLGFRDDIEAILGTLPEGHRTHLVSATFPREVRLLADAVQTDVVNVEGTPIGRANADIEHVLYVVHVHERFDAIVNLLLENPGDQTLIFARTRADVAAITRRLAETGFQMDSLSGEMEQRERNRALAAFKRGDLDALVATDVAARGIDVVDIAQVIHADPPDDPDSYTHRSGRTGRAGKKGRSSLILTPSGLSRATMLLRRAGVTFSRGQVPDANKIRARADEKLGAELMSPESSGNMNEPDPRALALARQVLESEEAELAVGRLIMRMRGKRPEPRDVTAIDMHKADPRGYDGRDARDSRDPRDRRDARGSQDGPPPARDLAPRRARNPDARWVSFRVSWGKVHGAEVRRVLAMVCRRGEIQSGDVGSIHVAPMYSIVDVVEHAAESFAAKAGAPDPRDPRVVITRQGSGSRDHAPHHEAPLPRHETPAKEAPAKEAPAKEAPAKEAPPPRVSKPRVTDPESKAPRERVSRPKILDESTRPKIEKNEYRPRPRANDDAPRSRPPGDAPRPNQDAPRPRPHDDARPNQPKHYGKKRTGFGKKPGAGGFGKKPGAGGFGKPTGGGGYPRPKEYTPGPRKPFGKK